MRSDEATSVLASITRTGPEDLNITVEEGRSDWEETVAETNAGLACSVTPLDLFGVPGELVDLPGPAGLDSPVVLLLHGGGYTSGSPRTHRELAMRLAERCGGPVVLPDYRLAPEYPCPAAIEDAVSAYRWLLAQGHRSDRIVIIGDSAGGGLTAAALVAIRDGGLSRPAGAVLLSPWTDLTRTGESYESRPEADPFITNEGLQRAAAHYLGELEPRTPAASPLFADLRDLPPLLIHVGELEILFSDSTLFAARAKDAGVDVTLKIWDGLWHVFHLWSGDVPEAREAIGEIGGFVQAVTARAEPIVGGAGGGIRTRTGFPGAF